MNRLEESECNIYFTLVRKQLMIIDDNDNGDADDAFPLSLQIKCDQYWPNRGTEAYGMIQITLLDTMELATFCVRTFSLHKVNSFSLRSSFSFVIFPSTHRSAVTVR